MNEALAGYFDGEKNGGLVLAIVGAVMLTSAVVFFPDGLSCAHSPSRLACGAFFSSASVSGCS